MPKAYGIIGGIGSGKSVVCRIFSILGIPIFDSDKEAKKIIQQEEDIKVRLIQLLGEEIYDANGQYQPEIVRIKINSTPNLLPKINAIVHPAVRFKAEAFFETYSNAPFTLYESALISKKNQPAFIVGLIAVHTPLADRINYLKKRNHWEETTIQEWLKRQSPPEFYLEGADYVIQNSKKDFLLPQCLTIYQNLVKN